MPHGSEARSPMKGFERIIDDSYQPVGFLSQVETSLFILSLVSKLKQSLVSPIRRVSAGTHSS